MDKMYKFETMFRGEQIIVEYHIDEFNKIEYAIVSDDTPNFKHPNYENCDDYLDEFFIELYQLAKNHYIKVRKANLSLIQTF